MKTDLSAAAAPTASGPSRLRQMAALGADWWNDSCDLKELAAAVAAGAVGATSNPVIVSAAVAEDRARWIPVLDQIVRDYPAETEDELAWRLIAQIGREAAAILQPIFARTQGEKGFLSMQVSSKYYPSRDRMIEQGVFLASLAPNIAIKAPAVAPGIAAMEEMTARGIRVNATVSFSVAQAVACAEAIERGLALAPNRGTIHPYVTIMIGRVDDQIKRAEAVLKTGVDPAFFEWAGVAVFRRAAQLFRERGYQATLLCAAYRSEKHWAEIIGPNVLQSIPYKWWRQFDAASQAVRVTIDDPVDDTIISALARHFPDFRAAYEEDQLSLPQFVHYGASIHTLNQFLGGYAQLLEIVRSRMLV
jgi:transaldolase